MQEAVMGEERILARRVTRRGFLAGTAAATLGGAAITMMGAECTPAIVRRVVQAKTAGPPHHRAWVWQFSLDGDPQQIAANLGANGIGVMLKTHDGLDWMSTFDAHPSAVTGPSQVSTLARMFEAHGVPFHAWCVVKGIDPAAEAKMAADVLAAGARSLTLDLEGGAGFWLGTADDAAKYGSELRARSPYGRVDISIDPRPWRINLVPMAPFIDMCDGISPQCYWDTFNSQSNIDLYRANGYTSSDGMSPEFLVGATADILAGYDREVIPAGQGASTTVMFSRFVRAAWNNGMGTTSCWRYGVTPYDTLAYLGQNRAGIAPQPARTPTRTPTKTTTKTATRTPTGTATRTPTRTSTPSSTATASPTASATSTMTPTPTATSAPTLTPSPVVTP
jgi:hypothetical protein